MALHPFKKTAPRKRSTTSPLPNFLLILLLGWLAAGKAVAQTAAPPDDLDLVEIQSVDPSIRVELKYQTTDNLAGRPIYPPEFRALLRRGVARALVRVQRTLQAEGLGLKIWDAWRPLAAQRELYAVIADPRYVSAPGQRSMHNRGVAVDVTLVDATGRELPMPTGFDDMTRAARYYYGGTDTAMARRLAILQRAMKENGFFGCRTEWWHFFVRDWQRYPNVDTDGLEPGHLIEGKPARSPVGGKTKIDPAGAAVQSSPHTVPSLPPVTTP